MNSWVGHYQNELSHQMRQKNANSGRQWDKEPQPTPPTITVGIVDKFQCYLSTSRMSWKCTENRLLVAEQDEEKQAVDSLRQELKDVQEALKKKSSQSSPAAPDSDFIEKLKEEVQQAEETNTKRERAN